MARAYTVKSKTEWAEILNLYGTGVCTLKEIAERYGISESSVTKKATAAGIRKIARIAPVKTVSAPSRLSSGGMAHATFATTTVTAKPLDPDEMKQAITQAKSGTLASADALATVVNSAIAALGMPTDAGEALALARTADILSSSLARVWNIRKSVLAIERENQFADAVLPDLPIRVMTDAEVTDIRRQQALDAKAAGGSIDRSLFMDAEEQKEHEAGRNVEIDE